MLIRPPSVAAADGPAAEQAKEIKSVCHKLEKIAKGGHHDSHHHVQHPHFNELRLRWEDALKGVLGLLEGLGGTAGEAKVEEVKIEAKVKVEEVVVTAKDTKGESEGGEEEAKAASGAEEAGPA